MNPFSFNPVKEREGNHKCSPNNTKMIKGLEENVTAVITHAPRGPLQVTESHHCVPIQQLRPIGAPEVETFNTLITMLFREAAAVNADTHWLDLLMEDNAQHIITGFPRTSSLKALINSLTERWSTAIPMSAVAPGRWPLLEQLLFVMARYPVAKTVSVALKKDPSDYPSRSHLPLDITRPPVCTGCGTCRSANINRAHVGIHFIRCCDNCGVGFNRDGYCATSGLDHRGSYHHPVVPCDSTWLVCLLYSITGVWGSSFKGNSVGATPFWTATHLTEGVAGHADNPCRLKSACDDKWRTVFGNVLASIFRSIEVSELTPAALYPTRHMDRLARSLFTVVGKNAAPAVAYLLMELSNDGSGVHFGYSSAPPEDKRQFENIGGPRRVPSIHVPDLKHGKFEMDVPGPRRKETGVTLQFTSTVSAGLPPEANRRDPNVSSSQTHTECFEHKIVHIVPPHITAPMNVNSLMAFGEFPGTVRPGLHPANGIATESSRRYLQWLVSRLTTPPWSTSMAREKRKLEEDDEDEDADRCGGCLSACPVCLAPFTNSLTWWILPCGHRVCSSCLAHILPTNSAPPNKAPEGWSTARNEFILMVVLDAFDRGSGAFLHPDWVILSRSQAITCGLQPPEQEAARNYPQGGPLRVRTTEVDQIKPPDWAAMQQSPTHPPRGDLPQHGHAPFAPSEAASTRHGRHEDWNADADHEPVPIMALPGTHGHKITYPFDRGRAWCDEEGWSNKWPKPLLNIKAACPLCKSPMFGEYKVHFSKTPFYPPYQVVATAYANKSCVGVQTWNCAFGSVPRPFKG
jgi:ferredoxin